MAVLWHKLILSWLTLYHKPRNLRKQGWGWEKHYSVLVDYRRPPSYAQSAPGRHRSSAVHSIQCEGKEAASWDEHTPLTNFQGYQH